MWLPLLWPLVVLHFCLWRAELWALEASVLPVLLRNPDGASSPAPAAFVQSESYSKEREELTGMVLENSSMVLWESIRVFIIDRITLWCV
jgi:hypothetical protein